MPQINNFPIQFNIPNLGFKSIQAAPVINPSFRSNDRYISNPLERKYETKDEIEVLARSNPNITKLLQENNLPLKVNMKALEELHNGHLLNTRILAAKMYSALPNELKSEVNLKDLQEAAMYHDYGKVLIPEKILDKKDKLNDEEWKIMQLHSEIGAELLKDRGLSEHSLELIKYHHQRPDGSGYPSVRNNYEYGIDSQILSTADKYTALTENRTYKESLSKDDALNIIEKEVEEGNISKEVFNALVKALSI